MQLVRTLRAGSAGVTLLMCSAAMAQLPQDNRSNAAMAAELETLKKQLAEQKAMLQSLQEDLKRLKNPVAPSQLEQARGTGSGQAGGQAQAAPAPSQPAQPADDRRTAAQGAQGAQGGGDQRNDPVGKAPERDSRPPAVAPLFEAPGVLTPRGHYVLEPSYQFGYSSSNRVALVGYTIIPALLIGLVDVRELKRNTNTVTLAGRYGLTNRTEVEVRLPYTYRSDSTVSRELFTGTAVENVFQTSGKGIGDVEVAVRHQINDGGPDSSYYVAGLRVKTRTGKDPFEVVTDCQVRCVGDNASGTGLPLDLPTGSGFWAIQPSLTWLFPSDPAVFFGSVSYLYNIKRDNVERQVLSGAMEPLGTVKPGAVVGFNFGMGLALNDKASLSLGYDHQSIARTKQNGVAVPGSVRTQLGTLLMGFSYRLNEKRTLNVTVGAGLTRDTPDVTLSVRLPMSF
ncbi:acetate kinase [Pseudoduganella sp. RAF19]|uniref:acetate kinase n=1 Tax=Pseudoduganella sp. RAF19 TaxID=3233052 RepID=UPI003F9CA14C